MEESFTVVRGLLANLGNIVRNAQPSGNEQTTENGGGRRWKSEARYATAGAGAGECRRSARAH